MYVLIVLRKSVVSWIVVIFHLSYFLFNVRINCSTKSVVSWIVVIFHLSYFLFNVRINCSKQDCCVMDSGNFSFVFIFCLMYVLIVLSKTVVSWIVVIFLLSYFLFNVRINCSKQDCCLTDSGNFSFVLFSV